MRDERVHYRTSQLAGEYCRRDEVSVRLNSNRLRCRLEFAVTSCKQTTAHVSNRRKSAIYSSTQNRLQVPLEDAFLIDRACRLEIDLTSAKSVQSKFLIVAESRIRHSDFRTQDFSFDSSVPVLANQTALACESCSASLDKIALHAPRPGGGMAYAEDLKSSVLNGTCGFDPHPGHFSYRLNLHQLGRASARFTSSSRKCIASVVGAASPEESARRSKMKASLGLTKRSQPCRPVSPQARLKNCYCKKSIGRLAKRQFVWGSAEENSSPRIVPARKASSFTTFGLSRGWCSILSSASGTRTHKGVSR